jgi:site-specific DNA recombinase
MGDQLVAAGYLRVSQTRDRMSATDIYRKEIEGYCRFKGLWLGKVFSDIDYSGRRGARSRPALEELVARRHEFSSVVIPKLSRFGRSLSHLCHLFDLFDADGIALVFLDMNVDTTTSQGRLLRNVMASFAEYESDVRSDYSRAAHRYLAERGIHNGKAPMGYVRRERGSSSIIQRERT